MTEGPMVVGIMPHEASDRLNVFQSRFDDIYRSYQTYSAGEQLFGLPITDYSCIHRIRKELALLQKLYGLYNQVRDATLRQSVTPHSLYNHHGKVLFSREVGFII